MARTRTKKAGDDDGPVRALQGVIPRTERLLASYAAGLRGNGVTGATILMPDRVLVQQLESRDSAAAGLGVRVGHEWVDTRLVGKSLLSCIYLEKFTSGLLVWRFVWYENGDEWAVLRLDISPDLRAMVHVLPSPSQTS